MTRVVIFQEYIPTYRVPFFELLRERARESGIEVTIAAGLPGPGQRKRGDAAWINGAIPVRQRELRVLGRRITVRQAPRSVRSAKFVILEQARRNLDVYRLVLPTTGRISIALWGHGHDFTHDPGRLRRSLLRRLTNRASWFFAYTDAGARSAVSAGRPMERVTVVQNSVDTQEIRRGVDAVAHTQSGRARLSIGADGPTAIFVGGLDESKCLPFLLEAVDLIREEIPNFSLLIAGDGPLATMVKEYAGTREWVQYLGRADGERKWEALGEADLILMPGRVGLVAVESFAARTPIVTTDWPHHAPEFDYLRNGENALVLAHDVSQYAAGVCELLRDPERLQRLASTAGESYDEFTIDAMVARFLEGLMHWTAHPRRATGRGV